MEVNVFYTKLFALFHTLWGLIFSLTCSNQRERVGSSFLIHLAWFVNYFSTFSLLNHKLFFHLYFMWPIFRCLLVCLFMKPLPPFSCGALVCFRLKYISIPEMFCFVFTCLRGGDNFHAGAALVFNTIILWIILWNIIRDATYSLEHIYRYYIIMRYIRLFESPSAERNVKYHKIFLFSYNL